MTNPQEHSSKNIDSNRPTESDVSFDPPATTEFRADESSADDTDAPSGAEATLPLDTIKDRVEPKSMKSGQILVGRYFGRYKIKRELGHGAMGVVYLAHDNNLDREVAVKIPKFGPNDGLEEVERFYREARAMATLRHPNLCPVYDVGEMDGVHYLTMAFIDGKPLSAFLEGGKSHPPRQVAAVLRKLALALHEAHQAGIVHRDLKPANIMLDGRNEPIIMDFGLARRQKENEATLTQAGTILGTPSFMSPEQVEGESERIGPSSDVYALGVICYQLLTGRLPFVGSITKVLLQIASEAPAPPSTVSNQEIDSEIEAICLKAMAKKPEDRYATAADFAKALRDYISSNSRSTISKGAPPVPARKPALQAKPKSKAAPPARPKRAKHAPRPAVPKKADAIPVGEIVVESRPADASPPVEPAESESSATGASADRLANDFFAQLGKQAPARVEHAPVVQAAAQSTVAKSRARATRPSPAKQLVRSWRAAPRQKKILTVLAAVAAALIVTLSAGAIVIRIATDKGEIVVKSYDPSLEVIVRKSGEVVDEFTISQRGDATSYRSGHYEIEIKGGAPSDVTIKNGKFTLSRGGEILVEIVRNEPEKAAPTPSSKPEPPENKSVDQLAAEWVLSAGGKVAVTSDGQVLNIQDVSQVPKNGEVIFVDLTGCAVRDYDLANVNGLQKLQHLSIDQTEITDGGFRQLTKVPQLEIITAAFAPIGDEGLTDLKNMPNLSSLNLNRTNVTDAGVVHLAANSELRVLQLENPQITDAGLKHLEPLKNLTMLDVREAAVTPEGVGILRQELPSCQISYTDDGQLVTLPSLEAEIASLVLELGGTIGVVPEGGEFQIISAVPDTPFEFAGIFLQDNKNVADDDLRRFRDLPRLAALVLVNTNITDTGLSYLAGAPQLKSLDLTNAPITDEGLAHIAKIAPLQQLNVSTATVTPDAVVALHEACPECKITYSEDGISKTLEPSTPSVPTQAAEAERLGISVQFTNSLGMEFRLIPAGEFLMGSSTGQANESPLRKVTITNSFYFGAHEVTQQQFTEIHGNNPSVGVKEPEHPVGMVQWYSAVDFCNKLSERENLRPCYQIDRNGVSLTADGNGYRLPTEAEWEYACRAGTTTEWFFGNDSAEAAKYAWFAENSGNQTHPVGEKLPNPYGLFDIVGNNWEWCYDWYEEPTSNAALVDPIGPSSGSTRVERGRFWISPAEDLRSAARHSNNPRESYNAAGFRVVLTAPSK